MYLYTDTHTHTHLEKDDTLPIDKRTLCRAEQYAWDT